jgi:lipopolysaccharide/colanic/teichoic acid biosynthesis glycosyltransferase
MSSLAQTTIEPFASARKPWPEIDCFGPETEIRLPSHFGWYPALKLILDYAGAILVLPLAAIVVGVAALLIKLTSKGPAFYTQTRLGLDGRHYKIIKLRTMRHGCEMRSGIKWSQKGDERITLLGKVLRTTHIDELPQVLNVLRGEMSLVGPRPERPEVINAKGLEDLVPGYKHRLLVKPGVTGIAQVQLPADTDINSVRYKVVYDLYYILNQSLWLDIRLLLATVFKAAGMGPGLLRLFFFLPGRSKVAAVFQSSVSASTSTNTFTDLQPA